MAATPLCAAIERNLIKFGMRVLQMKCQMVTKENDIFREKQIRSEMMGDMEREKQDIAELTFQVETLRTTISQLHREIKGLQDIISEQKVS